MSDTIELDLSLNTKSIDDAIEKTDMLRLNMEDLTNTMKSSDDSHFATAMRYMNEVLQGGEQTNLGNIL